MITQRGAGLLGHGVHAAHAVAGVEKTIQHIEDKAVARLQAVEHRADALGIGAHQMRGRRTVGLGMDVGSEPCRAVLDAGIALRPGASGILTVRHPSGGLAHIRAHCRLTTGTHWLSGLPFASFTTVTSFELIGVKLRTLPSPFHSIAA